MAIGRHRPSSDPNLRDRLYEKAYDATEPAAVLHPSGLYGDGHAGERIADIIEASFDCSRKRAVLAGE